MPIANLSVSRSAGIEAPAKIGFPGLHTRTNTARLQALSPSHPCSSNGGVSDLGFHPIPIRVLVFLSQHSRRSRLRSCFVLACLDV